MSDYKKLPASRVRFELMVEESDVSEAKKKVLERARAQVTIKGFRKGHAPDDAVLGAVGAQRIAFDALNQAVDDAYWAFIQEQKIRPVAAPKVDMPEKPDMPMKLTVEVDVFPEVELKDYTKIKVEKISVEVKDEQIDETIGKILAQMQMGETVDRAAKSGDMLTVDFRGKDKHGETLPNTDAEKSPLHLGSGQYLADLEKAFEGMKAGDEKKDVPVKFPKEYPSKDFAGKKVPFDIKVHEVKELKTKDLKPEIIQAVTGSEKTEEEFRADIRKMMEDQEKNKVFGEAVGKYQVQLLKYAKVDLPASWIEQEVESRLHRLKAHPQYAQDPEAFWKGVGKTEKDFRKEFESKATDDLKVYLILSQIVAKEDISLDKDEEAALEQSIAMQKERNPKFSVEAETEKERLSRKIDKYLRGLLE